MKLNLDQVETLQAVVETGSFAAASRALNKVQSAVSYDIRQMEERLGLEIFDRSGYRAQLTQKGRVLYEEGRYLLARAKRMEALAESYLEGWESHLKVVLDGVLPTKPVMLALKTMADEGVPTHIQVKMEFLGGVQYRFEQDQADLMVVKDFRKDASHHAAPLPRVECVLVTSASHPLAELSRQQTLSQADLREYVQLSIHDSSEGEDLQVQTHMVGGARVFYLSDFNTKHQGLLLGLGYGWMPSYLVQADLAAGELVELSGESRFQFTPYLVHPVHRPLGRAGQRFLQLLEKNLQNQTGLAET